MTMSKSAQDFARELTTIVEASANALTTLNRVLKKQQQGILMLASEGGESAPSPAGVTGGPRQAGPQASAAVPSNQTAPATEASAKAASPAPASPENLLAQAEKTAEMMIHHSPEIALAHIYQASAHAVSLALLNTVSAQQQLNIVAQAVVTRGAANHLSSSRLSAASPADKTPGMDRAAGVGLADASRGR